MQQQVRTIRLEEPGTDDGFPFAGNGVTVIAPGGSGEAQAGMTIRQALDYAGVSQPTEHQTVRVNLDEVRDMSTVLRQGDTVSVTQRLIGGSRKVTA